MNYTKEQAERVIRDYNDFYSILNSPDKFLDHKFPKKVSGWYRTKNYDKWLMYLDFDNSICYGFDFRGQWYKRKDVLEYSLEDDYLATPQEVEERLIEEAKRRGIVKGALVANAVNRSTHEIKIEPTFRYGSYYLTEHLLCDYHDSFSFTAFINGKWAEIIEQPETELSRTIKKAEKIADKLNHLLSLHHS